VGSSPNIIEASWLALADSLEYALLRNAELAVLHADTDSAAPLVR
jgi:hypothetical protein